MIPKRGSRRIIVEGVGYLWRLRKRPTRGHVAGGSVCVAVAEESGHGSTLLVELGAHPSNQVGRFGSAVTPGDVDGWVRAAVRDGWTPLDPGPNFRVVGTSRGRAHPRGRGPIEATDAASLLKDRPPSEITIRGGAVFVDDEPLLLLVAKAEAGHVARENAGLGTSGEAEPLRPGDYLDTCLLSPRDHLGVESDSHGFLLPEGDPRREKSEFLGCSCGNPSCWLLLGRIFDLPGAVVWADFEQIHRDWLLPLGPFWFDRESYVAAFRQHWRRQGLR